MKEEVKAEKSTETHLLHSTAKEVQATPGYFLKQNITIKSI